MLSRKLWNLQFKRKRLLNCTLRCLNWWQEKDLEVFHWPLQVKTFQILDLNSVKFIICPNFLMAYAPRKVNYDNSCHMFSKQHSWYINFHPKKFIIWVLQSFFATLWAKSIEVIAGALDRQACLITLKVSVVALGFSVV